MIYFFFDDYFILKIWVLKIFLEVLNLGVIVIVMLFGMIDVYELFVYFLLKLKLNYGI